MIREAFPNLTPSEKKVAHYILEYPEIAVGLSIGELAEFSGASKAAIIRFCKTLNFDGYRDFSIKLASDVALTSSLEDSYTDIQVGDTLDTIIRNVSHNNKQSIDDSFQVLDYLQVEKAIKAMQEARRIDFYGVGASGIIALDAQHKFMRINRYSMAYEDSHLQTVAATNLTEEDAAVFLSYSGETKDILDTLKFAKLGGATTISITRFGKNTLSSKSDIQLYISSPETSLRSGASASLIAQLNMIDILYTGIISYDYQNTKKYLKKTEKIRGVKRFQI